LWIGLAEATVRRVAEPQQLVPVTFRPTRSQRRYRLTTGVILVALSIFVFVHGAGAGAGVRGRVVGGVLFLLLGMLVLANRNAYTTIDRYGVRTSSLFGPRSCRWSEVTDVSIRWDRGGDAPSIRHVKIQRSAGRSFTLALPVDSSGRHNQNPDFGIQLATITSYWQSARSSPSGPSEDTAP
jgi:hypothetical protein